MNIQETYNEKKNNFLFSDSIQFNNLRSDLLKEFDLSLKNKKNNESLKYLDPQVLELSYKYKNVSNNINYLEHDQNNIIIDVIDGKISRVENNKKNNFNVDIANIDNKNISIHDKFLFYQNYFNQDLILNLNSLMLNSGYEINIAENQEINIFISNSISEEDLTIFQKNFIRCAKNSKVTIFEDYLSEKPSNNNVVNFIDLDEGVDVKHYIFQKNKEKSNLQSTSYTNCKSNAKYKQLTINISHSSIRNHHYANILGEGASVGLDGIFLASSKQIIDNKTQVNHIFPNSNSTQRYKGILTDQAKASYLSKTFVDKIAQKTEAYQLSKGILLSDNCSFYSKPELRIFADDVKCSHGSTIGPIDKDILFYLRSRGLNKKSSLSLIIKSFFNNIISEVDNKNLVEKYNYHSNIWLEENNI